jgi:hypothetical protein
LQKAVGRQDQKQQIGEATPTLARLPHGARVKYTSSEPKEPSLLKYGMTDPGTRVTSERISTFIERVFNSGPRVDVATVAEGEATA